LRFVPTIPHADQIKCAWKHASLENTQEEARGEQAGVVGDKSLKQGDQAESEHVDGQPDMGLEVLEQQVGRDLEEDVGDEEDDECRVELVVLEPQLDGQIEDVGIRNVDTVWRGKNVSEPRL
jgi:hypothetical protein